MIILVWDLRTVLVVHEMTKSSKNWIIQPGLEVSLLWGSSMFAPKCA